MRLSIFADKLKEIIVENGKKREVETDVLTVSGHKFLAMSQNVFVDEKRLLLDIGDWLEIEAVAVKLVNRLPHKKTNYLYESIHIYTLPHMVAEEIAEQLAEKFGEEEEMAIRIKEVRDE